MKKQVLTLLTVLLPCFLMAAVQEKDLRELHQSAEMALARSDFLAAKEFYQRLLEKLNPPSSFLRKCRMDWAGYVDVVTRLAYVHLALGEYDEGEELLNKLLERKIPDEFLTSVKLLQSRFRCSKQSPGDAYLLMKETSQKSSIESWRGEDRSLFLSLEYMLNTHYDELLKRASRFFSARYFANAKGMYEEVLGAIEKGYYPKASSIDSLIKKKVLFRLAESNYCLADYEKTLSLITPLANTQDQIDRQILYLAAMAYQEKHSYEKALDCFESYLHSGDQSELDHYEHALFEVGHSFYRSGHLEKARFYFEMLQQPGIKKGKPAVLGTIYLAKINLKEKKTKTAEYLLSKTSKELLPKDPLQYEIAYLRGKSSFEAKEYAQAAEFFELSFPSPPVSGEWCHDALFQSGWCYLKLGDDPLKGKRAKELFFSKAEVIFRRLLKTKEHERTCLALARLYLLRSVHFEEAMYLQAVDDLLLQEMPLFSQEGQLQAILLRAEGKQSYSQKEALYLLATSESYSQAPSYSEAWYYRGLNYFQEGCLKNSALIEKAVVSFEKAFSLIEKIDRKKAALLLKWEAHAQFYKNASSEALKACEKLLNDFPISMKEKEEILYLRGLVASHLGDEESFAVAKISLSLVFSQFPEGSFADASLYVLGSLYYAREAYGDAMQCFLQLAEHYPASQWAAEGLFWAAECAEKKGQPFFSLRRQVFEKYPTSAHADEAYFRLFPLSAYSEGDKEALAHLHDFSLHFSQSPLSIAATYLLGIHAASPLETKRWLEKGLESFEEMANKGNSIAHPLVYFRYASLLELAKCYLSQETNEEKGKGFQMLERIIKDFECEEHVFTSKLRDKTSYPSLYEESEFVLANAYLDVQNIEKAQEIFSKMLNHFSCAGVRESYFLSLVWQKQGDLALLCKDFETALRCFKMAEECGKNLVSIDLKLSFWISQSECYREQKAFDSAMRMLSQVINEDAISPLRVKAMLLRAEIYELQGRHELAIKQLKATAKKGGEWAQKAKEKLDSK